MDWFELDFMDKKNRQRLIRSAYNKLYRLGAKINPPGFYVIKSFTIRKERTEEVIHFDPLELEFMIPEENILYDEYKRVSGYQKCYIPTADADKPLRDAGLEICIHILDVSSYIHFIIGGKKYNITCTYPTIMKMRYERLGEEEEFLTEIPAREEESTEAKVTTVERFFTLRNSMEYWLEYGLLTVLKDSYLDPVTGTIDHTLRHRFTMGLVILIPTVGYKLLFYILDVFAIGFHVYSNVERFCMIVEDLVYDSDLLFKDIQEFLTALIERYNLFNKNVLNKLTNDFKIMLLTHYDKVPLDIFESILEDPNLENIIQLINSDIPIPHVILLRLARHPNIDIRLILAASPQNLTEDIILLLIKDHNIPILLNILKRRGLEEEILTLLFSPQYENLIIEVLKNISNVDFYKIIHRILYQHNTKINRSILQMEHLIDPHAFRSLLWFIRDCKDVEYIKDILRVYRNKLETTTDVYTRFDYYQMFPKEVQQVLVQYPNFIVRKLLAELVAFHSVLHSKTILQLSYDPDIKIRAIIVRGLKNPSREILKIVVYDQAPEIRKLLAQVPNLPDDIILILAEDVDYEVKKSLLEYQTMIPKEALKILRNDEHVEIREIAKKYKPQTFFLNI